LGLFLEGSEKILLPQIRIAKSQTLWGITEMFYSHILDITTTTTKTTSFITKLIKTFLQFNKSIQKRVIVTQDN